MSVDAMQWQVSAQNKETAQMRYSPTRRSMIAKTDLGLGGGPLPMHGTAYASRLAG